MKKIKILTVVGTRPEIIRLSRVIAMLDQYCDHILVHTGQNYDYELNQIFFDDLEIRSPDFFLNAAGKNSVETISKILVAIDKIYEDINPDAVLILGDTNSCMSVLPAKRRKIPTFHMEAGNRCFDMRVPEEINRRIVDHTADVNLPYSGIAREYLLREGLQPDMIIKTGSPMFEVLNYYKPLIYKSTILNILELQEKNYFLVSAHREENIESDSMLNRLILMLNNIAAEYNIPVVVSTHPRTKKRFDQINATFNEKIKLIDPLAFSDYNRLQVGAKVVLSDSGTINEESSILNFPAINIREMHERPEGMEEGAVMMCGFSTDRIKQAIEILKDQPTGDLRGMEFVKDYSNPNVSHKILRIIISYTDYVNRVIWKKY